MIDKIIRYVLIGLLVISIGGNVYFIFSGKGITIDKKTITTNNNHNEQFQGQISVNMYQAFGTKLVWKAEIVKNTEVINYLTSLAPQYSYFAKIVNISNTDSIIYIPEFMTEIKK